MVASAPRVLDEERGGARPKLHAGKLPEHLLKKTKSSEVGGEGLRSLCAWLTMAASSVASPFSRWLADNKPVLDKFRRKRAWALILVRHTSSTHRRELTRAARHRCGRRYRRGCARQVVRALCVWMSAGRARPSRHSFLRSSADRRERALMAAEQGERKNQRIAVDFRFLRRLGTRTQPEYISVHPQRKSFASSCPRPCASKPSASQS